MRQNDALTDFKLGEDTEMVSLIGRLDELLKSHDKYMRKQMDRNKVERTHGRASFIDNQTIKSIKVGGDSTDVHAKIIIIAVSSYPCTPDNIPIHHGHIFDSNSILSMLYLPSSLTVLGGGVIASEYATIFQALGFRR
jgi:NAD(P) transhydrogenase